MIASSILLVKQIFGHTIRVNTRHSPDSAKLLQQLKFKAVTGDQHPPDGHPPLRGTG